MKYIDIRIALALLQTKTLLNNALHSTNQISIEEVTKLNKEAVEECYFDITNIIKEILNNEHKNH